MAVRRLVLLLSASLWPWATAVTPAVAAVDYAGQIKPLFHEKCDACHGALKQKGGLRLDAAQLVRQGGDGGPAVTPGKAADSLLVHAVEGTHDVSKMPKDGAPLTADQLKLLRDWIDQGAVAPAAEPVPADPKDHWSFKPPVRPAVPTVKNSAWVRNPIDAFVCARHEALGLTPLPEAPKRVLLRRVYADLVGVPPTVEEMRAFLADASPDAYEKVVDKLLADPRHGQRWGRHWMDVWRYSDWAGFGAEVRESRPGIWRWRDWIVESLDADAPYDQMVSLMLAADELAPADPSARRAGGYLARSWYKFNRDTWLDATVEHAGKAFLGLTFNCARCHDHKYDPISQQDYYRLRAYFEPLDVRADRVAGSPDVEKDALAVVYDKDPAAPTYLYRRGDDKQPDKDHPLSPGTPAVFGPSPPVREVGLPPTGFYPAARPDLREDFRRMAKEAVTAAVAERAKLAGETGQAATPLHRYAVRAAEGKVRAAESELRAVEAKLAADAARYSLEVRRATGDGDAHPVALREPRGFALGSVGRADGLTHPVEDPGRSPWAPKEKVVTDLIEAACRAERAAAVESAEAALVAGERAAIDARQAAKPGNAKAAAAAEQAEKKLPALWKAVADAVVAEAALAPASAATPVPAASSTAPPATGPAPRPTLSYKPLTPIYPSTSTGRRSALAAWVTARDNPLFARVAVNHLWMRHVGEPLVPTEFDFGRNGKPPTNPVLLDWLAVELADHGWSMKHMHRLIVTSATYRSASGVTPGDSPAVAAAYVENSRLDPANQACWRANVRRLDAEAVRDSVLAVAGQLDVTPGGPELGEADWQTTRRRSLYYRHAPEKQTLFAQVFDAANPTECYRRIETVTPQQSLALANSPMAWSAARVLAAELGKTQSQPSASGGRPASPAGRDAQYVDAAFERVIGCPPTADERAASVAFLADQADRLAKADKLTAFGGGEAAAVPPSADPRQRARESLVHVLLNHNDFVTVR